MNIISQHTIATISEQEIRPMLDRNLLRMIPRGRYSKLAYQAFDAGHFCRIPLIAAAADGMLDYEEATPDALPRLMKAAGSKPKVILLNDRQAGDAGPRRWKYAPVLIGWCGCTVAPDASNFSYAHYVAVAARHRTLAIIETTAAAADAWANLGLSVKRGVDSVLTYVDPFGSVFQMGANA